MTVAIDIENLTFYFILLLYELKLLLLLHLLLY